MGRLRRMFRWAEVPEREDIYTWKGTTKWGNHDLYPIDPKERTFTWLSYWSIFVTNGVNISTFTLGSSFISYGLTAGQTIGGVLAGTCISAVVSYLSSRPGLDYHMGYAMINRSSFGLWGNTIPIGVVFIGGVVFTGLQSYFGGQALTIVLSAIIPQFRDMPNTLPESAGTTTQRLVGFILYSILIFSMVLAVPPAKIRRCLYPAFFVILTTFLSILIWALATNRGTGDLISSPVELTKSRRAFRMIQCISSVGGSYGGAAERFSDWTRFSKTRRAPTSANLLALPLTITFSATIGVLVTTATYNIYGTLLWNPLELLTHILQTSYTPAARAGVFFAGLGLLGTQISMNLILNVQLYGMDLAGLFPTYISQKRGAAGLIIATVILQPWRFLGQAAFFITILSVFTIFHASHTSIAMADYWIIRKKKWVVPDLFDPAGIYWFTGGWNLRAVAALVIGMAPACPGFIINVINPKTDNALVRMYQLTWFISLPISLVVYMGLCWAYPLEGLGRKELLPGPTETEGVEVAAETSSQEVSGTKPAKGPQVIAEPF
ncbi:hypothetical protein DM02DRAFT_710388 [Periconia macrospinosa]|uniref:Uncharacterized protein n=1 Tax=Periconia macrospinosa TaxID=97972 RepID=A0A2V1DNG2_9PLEO|nr:hypothetical protein DM02DRAFT_710388 [Periconia macrospinosa]